MVSALPSWVFGSLLLSLRLSPVFAFAPPFSLTPTPVVFRTLFGIGVAAWLAAANPGLTAITDFGLGALAGAGLRELFIGLSFVLTLHLMFAALYMAGRTIDIQAGFGLATLIDPTSQSQMPLVGTLFAFAAGAIFFALNGPSEVLRIVGASLDAVPLGGGHMPASIGQVSAFMSLIFLMGFGVAGGVILTLFMVDVAIAALSRTVPQMNVLVLGFQVKTLVMLVALPLSLGFSGVLLARMVRMTLEALPRMI